MRNEDNKIEVSSNLTEFNKEMFLERMSDVMFDQESKVKIPKKIIELTNDK